MKSEVYTFPIVFIFFNGCVSEVVPAYPVSWFIHISGKLWFCFHYYRGVTAVLCADYQSTLWTEDCVRLYITLNKTLSNHHQYADLSECIGYMK